MSFTSHWAEPSRVVVIGNGMVGQRFADELMARDALAAPGAARSGHTGIRLTVIGAETRPAYDRVALSSYFDGASAEDLSLADPDRMAQAGVDIRLGTEVTSIDRGERLLLLDDGSTVPYEQLVLATGSAPFVPPVPGAYLDGCFVYRTIDDLEAIRQWAEPERVTSGVVIGGGLLGLEAANALRNLALDTHVVEMADRLMPQQLDEPAAAMLRRWVDDLGVTTHLAKATEAIVGDGSVVNELRFADGETLPAQLVVFSAGIRPRHQLAEAAGLAIGNRGGVVIDDNCLTSDPRISAIGEVACHAGAVYGLVGPGYAMAATVADRLTGGDRTFEGADTSTKLKLLGIDVACFGTDSATDDRVEFTDPASGVHRRVSVAGGRVTGGVLIGDISNYDALHAMATGAIAADGAGIDPAKLIVPADLGVAPAVALPDSVQLCTCNNVTRGDCRKAVADG
ncbi:MAG: FAD-dependent oxidoreductase, partial [Actinomycetota bacterium]